MCHGANAAFLDLFGKGFVTSGSVMVPCPWFPEIANIAKQTAGSRSRRASDADQRVGRLSLAADLDREPRLGAARRRRLHVARRAGAQGAGRSLGGRDELRAQIERALASGIDATHLDTHMGAAAVPELSAIYLRLGRDYRLPVLLPREIGSYLDVLSIGAADRAAYAEAIERPTRSRSTASSSPPASTRRRATRSIGG